MRRNILIYPCSADNAIEIYQSIRYSLHINVYGANSKYGIADLTYDNPIIPLSNITDESFIKDLNRIIDDYQIDLIFPTHDDVVYFLSQNSEKINCLIIGGEKQVNKIARSKKNTYSFFKESSFVPRVFNNKKEIKNLPVFIKPDLGQGSIGARKINNINQILPIDFENNVITEYLPGEEFTVDCFSDRHHKLLYANARIRSVIRNGVSCQNEDANTEIQSKAFEIAKDINNKIKFKGLWFCQLKEDKDGNLKLMEICTRMATTMAFSRYKGVNLPLLSVFTYLDMDVKINIMYNSLSLYRYSSTKVNYNIEYNSIYIDFDDTIIINGKVCLDAIALIYQAKNSNKKVILISKHQFDIFETLRKYSIDATLFDDIIIIPMSESKSEYISTKDAIFIDNFHNERVEVFNRLKIPVFDVEGISNLINN